MKKLSSNNRLRHLTRSLAFVLFCSVLQQPVDAALVARWGAEEGTGAALSESVVGGISNGFLVEDAGWQTDFLAPVVGGTTAAITADGFDDMVPTGFTGITGNGSRTVAAWVRADPIQPNFGFLVSWGDNNAGERFSFRVSDGVLRAEVQGGFAEGTTRITDGSWHHVAVSYDTTDAGIHDVKFYVDGTLDTMGNISGANQAINTTVSSGAEVMLMNSSSTDPVVYGFAGALDDIRIYDDVQSPAQIAALAPTAFGSFGLSIDRSTGEMQFSNDTIQALKIGGYRIQSEGGAIDSSNWKSIAGNYDNSGGSSDGSVDSDNAWTILSSTSTELSEAEIAGGNGGTIASTQDVLLTQSGQTSWIRSPIEDVFMEVSLANGDVLQVDVSYTGTAAKLGDFDNSGTVTSLDWAIFKPNQFADLSALSAVDAYLLGDLDLDGDNDEFDFVAFKDAWEADNPGSFSAMIATVPEPTSFLLVIITGLTMLCSSRRSQQLFPRGAFVLASTKNSFLLVFAVLFVGSSAARAEVWQWHFDGNGNEAAAKTSFQLAGTATANVSGGIAGGSLQTDGDTGYAFTTAELFPGITGNDARTFSMWVKNDSDIAADPNVFGGWGDHDADARNRYDLGHQGGDSTLVRHEINAGFFTSAGSVNLLDGSWHHIVSTWDAIDTATIYIDGTPYGSTTYGGSFNADRNLNTGEDAIVPASGALGVVLGMGIREAETQAGNAASAVPGRAFKGFVDEVQIYDTSLSASNVTALFNCVTCTITPDGPVIPLTLEVATNTGEVIFTNPSGGNLDIDFYKISSASGNLVLAEWSSLEDQNLAAFPAGENNSGNGWEEAGGSSDEVLFESNLQGSSSFVDGTSVNFGSIFDTVDGIQDLELSYRLADGSIKTGVVNYGTGFFAADFDENNFVNAADLNTWETGYGISPNASKSDGDANRDGSVNGADFLTWQRQFGSSTASLQNVMTIPEPTSLFLCGAAALACCFARRKPMVLRTLILLCVVSISAIETAQADFTLDRNYKLGEDSGENAVLGTTLGSAANLAGNTYDGTGVDNSGFTDFQDLLVNGDPKYVSPANAASPGSTFAARFDGSGDFLQGLRLNGPDGSASSTNGTPASVHDYVGVTNRGFQFWVKPENNSSNQSLVMDTNQHGVRITEDGVWSMRYGANDVNTTIPVDVTPGNWTHVMLVRPHGGSGPKQGARLYIDGVFAAGRIGGYDLADNTPLVVGANTVSDATPSAGTEEFFTGTIDELQFFVLGAGLGGGAVEFYGNFNPATDNQFIAGNLTGVLGDVDQNGSFDSADVSDFLSGWGSTNSVDEVIGGDLMSINNGDLNLDGITDLKDARLMNVALGASPLVGPLLNLAALQSIPEPSSLLLVMLATGPLLSIRLRKRRAIA